jgi:hypothetical protein
VKQTRAEAELYDLERTHAMWAIDRAAMELYAPGLAHLPDYVERTASGKTKPGRPAPRPDWFKRIVWDCQAEARRRAGVRACSYRPDPEYDAAYDTALRAIPNGFRSCWRRRWRRGSRSRGIEAMMIDPRTLEVAEYVYRATSLTSLTRPSAGVALVSAKSRMTPSFPRSLLLARSCRPEAAITWLRRAIGAGSAASERLISQTSWARRTTRKSVTPHHESLFVDHDAPTFEDILEGWKLMDAERKRVFAITLY